MGIVEVTLPGAGFFVTDEQRRHVKERDRKVQPWVEPGALLLNGCALSLFSLGRKGSL